MRIIKATEQKRKIEEKWKLKEKRIYEDDNSSINKDYNQKRRGIENNTQ